jgi:hypothetical protein
MAEIPSGISRFLERNQVQVFQGEKSGEGFAEVFMPTETHSPSPGQPAIELQNIRDKDPKDIISGEALHFMGGSNASNQPFHPQFHALKQEFIGHMTERQMQVAQGKLDMFKKQGKTGTNFQDAGSFIYNVFSDELIRGGIFPQLMLKKKEQEAFERGDPFSPEQKAILEQMKNIVHDRVR